MERVTAAIRGDTGGSSGEAALYPGAHVALMVNSLGATTVMELNIAARHALEALANMQARSLHL